jgi:hypothetical protein
MFKLAFVLVALMAVALCERDVRMTVKTINGVAVRSQRDIDNLSLSKHIICFFFFP